MNRVAIFDFDHTLITGDSFFPFLSLVNGKAQTVAALTEAVASLAIKHARGEKPETRFFVKNYLLYRLLAGKNREDLRAAAVRMFHWQTPNPHIANALREHAAQGDKILIASGGLDLYLPEMLRDTPHDALLCTDIGVENGIVTGEMINGNCVRQRKAERVAEWLATHGPFGDSFAYGNYPHDLPMMNLVTYRIIVS
jgi:HAD superfamily hydrolase (TIGR01490 family)